MPQDKLQAHFHLILTQYEFEDCADAWKTAIATSVDLRCFAVLTPRSDSKVGLEVPNFSLESEWDIASLPWNLLPVHTDGSRRQADKELDTALLQALESVVRGFDEEKRGATAQVTFLYLYMVIAGSQKNA